MTIDSDRAETKRTSVPVLIVGAGPTGLVLALWLTRLGVAVRIIDKTAEAGTTSRALAVQVRTLEFYRQVGIADALVERGVKIAGVNLWVKGARAARVPLQNIGESLTPYPFALVFPQDAHERLLIERPWRLAKLPEAVCPDRTEAALRRGLHRHQPFQGPEARLDIRRHPHGDSGGDQRLRHARVFIGQSFLEPNPVAGFIE